MWLHKVSDLIPNVAMNLKNKIMEGIPQYEDYYSPEDRSTANSKMLNLSSMSNMIVV
jgi:hypothetical protein